VLKRFFDICCSLLGLIILSPILFLICIFIIINNGFPVFYLQTRVGKNGVEFKLFKFRSMYKDADKKGLLTVGGRDPRVTPIGYFLRKYKLDELPQLLNVFLGSMSLVGPRPEVRKYVELYNQEQKRVLLAKPGITDYASLEYFSENELLAQSDKPEDTYINEIMPIKLKLNLKYIEQQNLWVDLKIISLTILKIFR
jgi:lipopolysaccharide/colanic/teichoic acid biosynthesis glycosyltransferase